MNISGATSCFPNGSQGNLHMFGDHQHHVAEDVVSSSVEASSAAGSDSHSTSLLYSLSILKDKVYQVQSLVSIFISPPDQNQPESTSIAIANMGTLIQEIIVTASSMMFTCQQMALGATSANNTTNELHQQLLKQSGSGGILSQVQSCSGNNMRDVHGREGGAGGGGLKGHVSGAFYSGQQQPLDWYGDHHYDNSTNNQSMVNISNNNNEVQLGIKDLGRGGQVNEGSSSQGLNSINYKNYDIIELNAADLLAKYTHYCQVCGKGFKRDANLRMHMRAHGDEYKSSAALSNPMKSSSGDKDLLMKFPRKYSCPQEGCRWNKRHAKFQPLKSMICVKNHYKRSHCPKMYVCKRCNQKQFSVLSDLRTHEKHCGDLKWQCSCGTTFSRKDKLMGHVALFVGHSPAINSLMKLQGKVDQQVGQMQ